MSDREKLLRGLQNRINESRNRGGIAVPVALSTLSEALMAVREQEPGTTEFVDAGVAFSPFSPGGPAREWKCKNCGVTILVSESGDLSKIVFCWNCGKRVKSDG